VVRRCLAAAVCVGMAALAGAGQKPAEAKQKPAEAKPTAAALVARLGSESPAARDKALEALVARGEQAVPALEGARTHKDAEVRWRAAVALHRIRWRIGPKLAARIGDLMDDFESLPVGERETVCRDLALAGQGEAVPTLRQVLTRDPSRAVR